jgi:hypothetical protein
MPYFVLNRNYTLATLHGHRIGFEKGKPAYVPPTCVKDVVAIGAEPVDGDVDVLGPEPVAVVELTADERETMMFAAFEQMEASNTRGDFNAQGLPNVKPLAKITGFEVEANERNEVWQKYRESKAE